MVTHLSVNNLPIFARVTSAFAIVLLISAGAIGALSFYYYTALLARDQAVKISFDAQQTANAQQVNLQRMNALLQTRFAQVFATTGGSVQDPSLRASGALINIDILTREDDFNQALQLYRQQFEFATSPTMRGVRAIVLSDDPNNTISRTQQDALSTVAGNEWPRYQALQDQELQLLDPRLNPTLVSNPRSSYQKAYTTLFQANQVFLGLKHDWQHVVDSAQTIGEVVTNVGKSQTQPIVQSTLTALLMTIVVIMLIGFVVNNSITRPLRQLAMLTRRIAAGDRSARAPERGRDEIQMVASSMNMMLDTIVQLLTESQSRGDRLQLQIERLAYEVSGVGHGDLRVQADVALPDLRALAMSFNFMVGALSTLVVRVKLVAQRVVHSTMQTSQLMNQLVESAGQQLIKIDAVSQDVEHMAQASQQVAQQAVALSAVAVNAHQSASKGTAAVQQTVEGMERITENVLSTAQKVRELEQSSSAINDISKYMHTIATTTNRLSLDAAIQAQMAGESGKGFAEVAASIRGLAEQAKEQAARIAHIVRTVRQDIAEVQFAMSDTTQETQKEMQLASQTDVALASIFTAVQRQAEAIEEVNQVAKEHVQLSNSVKRAIQHVRKMTQQNSSATQEAAQQLGQQGQLVAQLRFSVEAFRVRDERSGVSRTAALVQEERGSIGGPISHVSGTLPPENPPGRVGVRPPPKPSPTRTSLQQPQSQ